MYVVVNVGQVCVVGGVIEEVFNRVVTYLEDFTDPDFYPSRSDDPEQVLRYFFFMVSIDHRTSRGTVFEDYINGKLYHGADLLYRLGKLKYDESPDFFNPKNMSRISTEDVIKWLRTSKNVVIWDPSTRTDLLRDAALKLLKYFNGSVTELLRRSEGYIRHPYKNGLSDLFKVFKAYSDPVEKKFFLFLKFVMRRGLLEVRDPQNVEVPVDNHLSRLALRLRLIELDSSTLSKVLSRVEFTEDEDVKLRFKVRYAYKLMCRVFSTKPDILDDFLWVFGRKYCSREGPTCEVGGSCPISKVCPSFKNTGGLVEHNFTNTFYY